MQYVSRMRLHYCTRQYSYSIVQKEIIFSICAVAMPFAVIADLNLFMLHFIVVVVVIFYYCDYWWCAVTSTAAAVAARV